MTIITSRRTVILALSLLALCFIYLGINNGETATNQGHRPDGETVVEAADIPAGLIAGTSTGAVSGSTPGEITGEEETEGDAFFTEYRLNRDRRRAQEIELLQSMLNSTDAASEVKQEVQYKLLEITNAINQELSLETLIMAKGYADAVAVVQPEHVTVVVRDADFTEEDAARIADLVTKTTGVPLSKVTIFAKR
ncbi:MAG TPA: SpoIIIAH-like family protein [Clostridia bacterium]|nr:SpoIIIAH-like family protein [Clostridia bacterium]